MKWKRWASVTAVVLLSVGVAWTFLVVSYESPLGTNNRVLVSDPDGSLSNGSTDEIVSLSFAEGGEDLAWTSVQIELTANEQQYTCSFGSQSAEGSNDGSVKSTLGADGSTFTTVIDATMDTFTYFDLPNQQESNESDHTMKFSKTDIFFSEGIQWAFIEDKNIDEITSINTSSWSLTSPLSVQTTECLSPILMSLSNGSTDEIVSLSFAEGGEDLAWTSVQIELT
ncbi:MAG: hypothetical protein L7U53_03555, partial [Candidatus Poseidoniaceae archaeon]|nr:hypothetical protein [Candidatus Poseidoniaceae archaeon]